MKKFFCKILKFFGIKCKWCEPVPEPTPIPVEKLISVRSVKAISETELRVYLSYTTATCGSIILEYTEDINQISWQIKNVTPCINSILLNVGDITKNWYIRAKVKRTDGTESKYSKVYTYAFKPE
jgi:hypothetical protein